MSGRAMERLTLEAHLRRAVENGEPVLHHQPQIDFATRRIVGAEALIRWQHPKLGFLAPGEFIPMAEETGLILPIGDWGLRIACNQVALWDEAGLRILRVVVNV